MQWACQALDCRFNRINRQYDGGAACDLQRVTIGLGGACQDFEKLEDDDGEPTGS